MFSPSYRDFQETPGTTPRQFSAMPTSTGTAPLSAPLTENPQFPTIQIGGLPPTTSSRMPAALPVFGTLSNSLGLNTTARQPIVIRGAGKKQTAVLGSGIKKGKRPLFIFGATVIALLVIMTTLAYTVPVGTNGKTLLGTGDSNKSTGISLSTARNSNSATIDVASQAITATAITEASSTGDSYVSYDGTIAASTDEEAYQLSRFASGNCTYWANYRYHYLTGVWVPWPGNAYEWYANAINAGWHYSEYPNPNGPSILVMAPYTMGNGALGHVAIAESINGDGTVSTSNWNWGPQNWGVTTYMDVPYPLAGLNYVWV
jgi:surface antigen